MKKNIVPIVIIILLAIYGIMQFNNLVSSKGKANIAWADVESQYQRRYNLFDNLVETVNGYANHEKETLEAVIKARAEATKTTIDPSNMTPENMAAFQKSQSGLMGAFNKLMVSVERYPELKANQNFLELQSQIEGTENRINTARMRFNEAAGSYNIYKTKFPRNIIAKVTGFDSMNLFKGETGSEKAPKVEF